MHNYQKQVFGHYQAYTGKLCVMLIAVFLLVSAPVAGIDSKAPHYKVGIVPQFSQRQLFTIWQPILKALTARTGFQFSLVGTAKIPEFELEFRNGNFDIAYMNPYHMLKAHNSQGYEPIVRDGARVLRGILVVHKDSEYTDPSQLQNKTLALPSPNAMGASLLIRADLKHKFGIIMQPLYVKTHSSVYLHVAKKLAVAGGGVQRTLDAQPADLQQELRVIYSTRAVIPHPITVHPRVPAAHRKKIQAALLALARTDEGKKMLSRIPMQKMVTATLAEYSEIGTWGLDAFYE